MNSGRSQLTTDALPILDNRGDRLPPMLFLAALFYGLVILGITFDAGLSVDNSGSLTLDVVVLNETDQRIERPDDAAYLAAVSQLGTGNTELEVDPGQLPGGELVIGEFTELLGDLAPDQSLEELTDSSVVARDGADMTLTDDEKPEEADQNEASSAATDTGFGKQQPVPVNLNNESLITNKDSRKLVLSVDTKESVHAEYLAAWIARVESEGAQIYKRQISGITVKGAPIIDVEINSDGTLAEIIIVRSSGDGRIDQAAINVLRHAAPYPPFSQSLRKNYDLLKFVYEFEFAAAN